MRSSLCGSCGRLIPSVHGLNNRLKRSARWALSEHEVTEGSPAHPPTLSDYYADPGIKASSFIKTVRSAKVKAFATEDAEHAQKMLAEKDPDLARTLGLAL